MQGLVKLRSSVLVVLILYSLLSLANCASGIAVGRFSARVRLKGEHRSDQISFTLRAPPDGICISTDLLRFVGEDAAFILFRMECGAIVSTTNLDELSPNTTVKLPLSDVRSRQEVTVNYQRFIRSVALNIEGRDKVSRRLSSRTYIFKPLMVDVYTHPIVCVQSALYNTVDVLSSIPNLYCREAVTTDTAIIVQAYTGDTLNLSAVFDRFPDCGVTLVSQPEHGKLKGTNLMIYECNDEYFTGMEKLWFLSQCEDNSKYLIPLQVMYTQASMYVDTSELKVSKQLCTVTSDNIEISRTTSDFGIQSSVVLSLSGPSAHGDLTLAGVPVRAGDTFNEDDISAGSLIFNVLNASRAFESRITITAKSTGTPALEFTLPVIYRPELSFNISSVYVAEGESVIIDDSHLHVQYGLDNDFMFSVSDAPKFGVLVFKENDSELIEFSQHLLSSNNVKYIHGGSESANDDITLRVHPVSKPLVEDILILPINVQLVNDNPPVRNTSSTIQVVKHKDTSLSSIDLLYTDLDIHQTAENIHIERNEILCGDLTDLRSLSPVYKFTQADLNSGNIVYRHTGDEMNCQLDIWVSDEIHFLSEVLDIQTVEHDYQIGGSRLMNVERGGQTTLDTSVLNIVSNTNIHPRNIVITLSRYPQHGNLFGPAKSETSFTYEDIINEHVKFVHVGTISISDNFRILIEFDGITVTENLDVMVKTDPDLLKPIIQFNLAVAGYEGSAVVIDNEILNVYHPLADRFEIIYQLPDQNSDTGFSKMLTDGSMETQYTFTQEEVDRKQLFYRVGPKTKDFTILVSFKGISTDLVFRSITLTTQLEVANNRTAIVVAEGGRLILTPLMFTPRDLIFQNTKLRIDIITPPSNGAIYKNSAIQSDSFSWTELSSGQVSYQHDNSETLDDSWTFRLSYISNSVRSAATECHVKVQPINDHLPTYNQTGELKTLVAWMDDYTPVTNSSLFINDMDSGADSLTYSISFTDQNYRFLRSPTEPGTEGVLHSVAEPSLKFTQHEINNGLILLQIFGLSVSKEHCIIRMTVADEDFQQPALLNIEIKKKQLYILHNKPLQVFPGISVPVSTEQLSVISPVDGGIITYNAKSKPSHGTLSLPSQNEQRHGNIIIYTPNLSSHLTKKLCRDVGRISVSDKFSLLARDETLDIQRSVMIRVNISYVNINNNTMRALGVHLTPALSVIPEQRLVISSNIVNADKVADILRSCDSEIELGFLIRGTPSGCEISGLDAAGIVMWPQIVDEEVSIWCDKMDFQGQQVVFMPKLVQNGNIFNLEKNDFSIIAQLQHPLESMPIKRELVFLLQGHHTALVEFSDITETDHYTIISEPVNGKLSHSAKDIAIGASFTGNEIRSKKISYRQMDMRASSDQFDIYVSSAQDVSAPVKLRVEVVVAPNVQSPRRFLVSGQNPIRITTDHLDASPLKHNVTGEIIYYIDQSPIHGQLRYENPKINKHSAHSSIVTSFSQEDIINELILYYPPNYIPEEKTDNFTYTLISDNIQPADGVFTMHFTETVDLFYTPTQSPIQQGSVVGEAALTILLATVCILICTATLVVTVLCLRRVNRKKKRLARQALLNSEPRLVLAKENGSYKLLVAGSGDFPATPLSSPPSPCHQIDSYTEAGLGVPELRLEPNLQTDTDGIFHDIHDYVNCEDLPSYRSRISLPTQKSNNESSSHSHLDGHNTVIYGSLEHLPPIKKPQYFC